ncbi:DUF4198 domain-containing protein [uncultured Croceitalea sp.]|uniref:DUF4198 domain-containing protein n=1 Tax=uncultured Croceitalea sp. TaxID=1798908 RepID=UPI0033065AD0
MRRLFSLVLLVVCYVLFSSHELFLKTDTYFIKPNTEGEMYLFNGTFDKSENIITRDRIVAARIVGPSFDKGIANASYYDKNKSTYLRFTSGEEGTYVAGISTKPKMIALEANKFNEYLEHEGLEDTINERKADGSFDTSANERYSKHVKTLIQVGDKRTEEYGTVLGFPIEFVAKTNPYTAKVGEPLSFQLLRDEKPLSNHICHFSTSMPGKDAHENENSTRTDENGMVTITPTQMGNWYVATIHMEKRNEKGVDYESNWATITFAVQ